MESKLVTQTPTGQIRHTDAIIIFVTQTRHTDANKICTQSTETNASNTHARMATQTPTGQIRHTDE